VIKGIKEGADDILTKPFDLDEFQIRIHAGERIVHLEEDLLEKNKNLQMANDILRGNLISGQEAQKSLLPSGFPDISNMEFAASFIPSAFGSGDIYNIFRLDEKNIGLYNIDVSGHGVSAALFSVCLNQRLSQDPHSFGLVKIATDEPPYYHINTPLKVVKLLNEEDMLGKYGRFFTMVYAIVNVETGNVSFCRAGHNYPLLVNDTVRSYYIEGGGPPIGLGLTFRDTLGQSLMLSPGDQFVLFSDGINDAFSPTSKKRYGLKRAKKVLTEHYQEPLQRAFESLIADVQKFIGKNGFSDDISILGCRWLGDRTS
jgi:sigma-B regulation protein RsbU (phosphoserine phosphatase)